ncbi:MAG: hypothetical protein E7774_02310 [Bradyrhizobium sp.]|nr:MAG: hypothetical protein E7774_02310 [Bradyrhizobium sp.]
MAMLHAPLPLSGPDDLRLAPALNLLWAGGQAFDSVVIAEAAALLHAAAHAAAVRWPDVYHEPMRTRLICRADERPPAALVEAAQQAGLEVDASNGATATCDLALTVDADFAGISATLPALVATAGAPLQFALDAGAGPQLEGAPRRRILSAATPETVAEKLLSPPRRVAERRKLGEYLTEDASRNVRRYEYALLLRLIGEPADSAAGAPDDAWERAVAFNAGASVDRSAPLAALRREQERGDALALAYGRLWRSSLSARSLLLFAANFASGFVGAVFPAASPVTLPLQFGMTGLLYLDQHLAKRNRWRAKWIDYRRVAEVARIGRFCVLAGVAPPVSPDGGWIDWRLERVLRAAPPPAPLPERDAPAFLAHLSEVEIDRQIAYHRGAYRRFRRLDARLRRAALTILLATMAVGAGLAVVAISGLVRAPVSLLSAVGLALSAGPGLFAALNGLRTLLDVQRQGGRSARIGLALRRLRRTLASAPPSALVARSAAARAAEIMLDDVSAWDRAMEIV